MAATRAFCPRCGATVAPDEALAQPDVDRVHEAELCRDCYFETFDLVEVPDRLTVHTCTGCGAVHEAGSWHDVDATADMELAIDAVAEQIQVHRSAEEVAWEVEQRHRDPNTIYLTCLVSAVVHGRPVIEEHDVIVAFMRETCTRCGQVAGKSYGGTIQVRGDDRIPTGEERDAALTIADKVVSAVAEGGDREAFITEVIDRPEGVDIRVSTPKMGARVTERIIDEFGGSYSTSETLVTEDGDGRGVYRVAYAIRLPRFRPGDIVSTEEHGPVLITSAATHLKGRRLATGEDVEILDSTDPDLEVVGSADDVTETTLVAIIDEQSVQVLDPETHRAETIPLPEDLHPTGEMISVVRTDEGLFVLPPTAIPGES